MEKEANLSPIARFARKIKLDENGCWRWLGTKVLYGYGMLWHDGTNRGAHRLAYRWFVGRIPPGFVVRHKCNVPDCVNPRHLCVGTQADNIKDRDSAGNTYFPKGEKNVGAKLTEVDVLEIRRRSANGETNPTIARDYSVLPNCISRIVTRARWTHV